MWEPLSKYLKLLLLHVPHRLSPYSFTEKSDSFSDVNFALVRASELTCDCYTTRPHLQEFQLSHNVKL
ncbi:Hypothetical predicted protein [Octopus vulgaris]|uniref:Uncharacterized protein n=1 Tax=Octopus vulgaris TaxID=6645 RepID=A0AA36FCS5_OCTVU|nr:Hypothetical predicted protein [Octopus vulgaris]